MYANPVTRAARQNVLKVECPVCYARIGQPCVTPTRIAQQPHRQRYSAYLELNRKTL